MDLNLWNLFRKGKTCIIGLIKHLYWWRITIFLQLSDSIFSFQNNPKNQDPSYKMDLDLWDFIRKGKTHIIGLIKLFIVILERENPVL